MNNAHMMISRLMMEDALHFSAIMNYRHQCSWMSRPSCFIHSLFFVLSRHISSTFFLGVSCPLYFIHESWFIHLSPAHLHPFMSRPSYFIPSFFLGLARHISSTFFFFFLPVLRHPLFFWGPLVCHISSTKVCSFICPPLIARIHVSYVIFHPRKFVHSSVRRSSPLLARICVYAFVCVSRAALSAMAGVVGISVCFLQVLFPRRSC